MENKIITTQQLEHLRLYNNLTALTIQARLRYVKAANDLRTAIDHRELYVNKYSPERIEYHESKIESLKNIHMVLRNDHVMHLELRNHNAVYILKAFGISVDKNKSEHLAVMDLIDKYFDLDSVKPDGSEIKTKQEVIIKIS